MSRSSLAPLVALAALFLACGGDPRPPPKAPDDGVPANSSAESRLSGTKEKAEDKQQPESVDPTQPLMTPVGAAAAAGDDEKKPKAAARTGPVSKQECNEALDHGLELMVSQDPRFQGIPPEMLQQLKSQALKDALRDHAGQNPCTGKGITRGEYDCEMAASTPAEFQKCEKKGKK